MKQLFPLLFIILFAITGCQPISGDKKDNTSLIIREGTDAHTLNPVAAGDPFSIYLSNQLFQPLLSIDFKTNKPVGVLAKSMPEVMRDSLGRMFLTYTLRKEAKFDNGELITAEDVLFSLKINILPAINNLGGAYSFDFIEDFKLDENDSQKFTIVSKSSNVHNIFKSGDFSILPQKFYDSSLLMNQYTINQLYAMEEADSQLAVFAEKFNRKTVSILPKDYNGSGSYKLKEWVKGERIILEKKTDWWAAPLHSESMFFTASPTIIRYEIIPDPTTAIAALKSKQVDFVKGIPTREFAKLDSTQFKLAAPLLAGYTYVGFNLNDSILKQLHVRQAIEACVPFQRIVEIIYQNQSIVNRLPLAIQDENLRNNQLKIQGHDLSLAKQLLNDNGWKDVDGNGIVDKLFNGVKRELRLTYHYNAENDERKEIGLLIKAELKKIGIQLDLIGIEWTEYLKMLRQNKLQVFVNGSLTPSLVPNFASSFHSKSANGGRNYANYQSTEADSLISQIKLEFDERKRKELIYDFQRVINRDKPYLFLFSKRRNIAISKRLSHTPIYDLRPHFWAPEFN